MDVRRRTKIDTVRHTLTAVAVTAAMILLLPRAEACLNCGPIEASLTTRFTQANAVLVVHWVKGTANADDSAGNTTYRIEQRVKGPQNLAKAQVLRLEHFHSGKVGDRFLLLGTDSAETDGLNWGSPTPVTQASLDYVLRAPSIDAGPGSRLTYFLKFLDHSEEAISADAFSEFAVASFEDIEKITSQLPKAKLRRWLNDPDTSASRLGLYGLMLGLCGDDSDAAALEKWILIESEDYRIGIDGIMVGYLLIRKHKGLDVLDRHKLRDKTVPFTEAFATMQALRFLWTYGNGRIAPDRLRESMRIALDRPEMSDLVIADLARWKDWSVQDKLRQMYDQEAFNTSAVKQAIARYLIVSMKEVGTPTATSIPEHAARARKYLDELRRLDPQNVSAAERFFIAP